MVVIRDDESSSSRGALIAAGGLVTPEIINFMARTARGVISLVLPPERCDALGLEVMSIGVDDQHRRRGTRMVSIEARQGVSTGISAADRARTIRVASDPDTRPDDLVQPGHVQPFRARAGGVLDRTGLAETAIDLARAADVEPACAITLILNADGTVANGNELTAYAGEHGLLELTTVDLIAARVAQGLAVERLADVTLTTTFGEFRAVLYRSRHDDRRHAALIKGSVEHADGVLVRVQRACLAGDVFGSRGCHCRPLLEAAMARIAREGTGVLVHVGHPDGHFDVGEDPAGLTLRDVGVGAQILLDLGVREMRLLTSSTATRKIFGLGGFGLSVRSQVPLQLPEGWGNTASANPGSESESGLD
jgi:3,4-dihydroxy 2-butanone 4-phosphate synthase / GTP cyclohydrolase II